MINIPASKKKSEKANSILSTPHAIPLATYMKEMNKEVLLRKHFNVLRFIIHG
jgi:hypothetical protein